MSDLNPSYLSCNLICIISLLQLGVMDLVDQIFGFQALTSEDRNKLLLDTHPVVIPTPRYIPLINNYIKLSFIIKLHRKQLLKRDGMHLRVGNPCFSSTPVKKLKLDEEGCGTGAESALQ